MKIAETAVEALSWPLTHLFQTAVYGAVATFAAAAVRATRRERREDELRHSGLQARLPKVREAKLPPHSWETPSSP